MLGDEPQLLMTTCGTALPHDVWVLFGWLGLLHDVSVLLVWLVPQPFVQELEGGVSLCLFFYCCGGVLFRN